MGLGGGGWRVRKWKKGGLFLEGNIIDNECEYVFRYYKYIMYLVWV